MPRLSLSIFVAISYCIVCPDANAQEISAADESFFETRIRPVLIEHCFKCHGPQAKRVEANLRLDSITGMRKGGDNGNTIIADGDQQSLLLSALEYDQYEMPPSGKLSANVIEDFKKWINSGTKAPESFQSHGSADHRTKTDTRIDWEQARNHWAFRPIRAIPPPTINDKSWNQNPIDAIVFDQLRRNGQQPVGLASQESFVRRLYFNLIGLPPTRAEINEFINDDSPDAELRLIDQLLASSHYGERWGRHWLDVVRYADSNGADENHPYPHAWRYRNYVIEAFNLDTPFDQFLIEQLAGDLLPPTENYDLTNRRLSATTFLSLGIKIDAEKDQEKKRADIIDEQLDTIGRSLIGMTIGCARCHDHKFDPIPTSDYYALSGILRSTQLKNRRLVSAQEDSIKRKIADLNSQVIEMATRETERIIETASQNPTQYILAARKVNHWRLQNLDANVVERTSTQIKGSRLRPIGEISQRSDFVSPGVWRDAESFQRGEAVIENDNYGKGIGIVSDRGGDTTWVEYDFELPSKDIYQVEFRYAAANPRPGQLSINGIVVNHQCMGETTGSWHPDGQKWHVEGRYEFAAGKNTLRFEVQPNMSHLDELIIVRVGKPQSGVGGNSAAPTESPSQIADKESLDLQALNCWSDFLNHESTLNSIVPTTLAQRLVTQGGPLSNIAKAEKYFSAAIKKSLNELRVQISELNQQLEKFSGLEVMSVADGAIDDAVIFIRGNHRQHGAKIPRRFLTIVNGDQQTAYPKLQSGRLELAQAITAKRNPLTARVIANRIWRWHFGRGIVETTDNFGLSGANPTHPELLDFLASYLLKNDWSIKALQRLIVSSRTYKTSSQFSAKQSELDPDNINLWRWQPRRLEAEVIRDSLLRISGQLDDSVGGAPLMGVTTANPSPQDLENNRDYYQNSARRTVYLPIVRTNVFKFLTLFDFPNPAAPKGNRDSTTVPTQALFLLNSSWVRDLATQLADHITNEFEAEEQRIEHLYISVLGRAPKPKELIQAKEFLANTQNTWPAFCHVILMSNEFLYLK